MARPVKVCEACAHWRPKLKGTVNECAVVSGHCMTSANRPGWIDPQDLKKVKGS